MALIDGVGVKRVRVVPESGSKTYFKVKQVSNLQSKNYMNIHQVDSDLPKNYIDVAEVEYDNPKDYLRVNFVNSHRWTPNFNGVNSYGQLLSAWQPTGADWSVEFKVFFANGQIADTEYVMRSSTVSTSASLSMYKQVNLDVVYANAPDGFITIFEDVVDNTYATLYTDNTLTTTFGTSDIFNIAASHLAAQNLDGQIHSIKLTDLNDPSNSIEIDTVIRAAEMPTETSLYNKLTGLKVGDLYNLGTDQPYVPQLKGGEIDRSQVDGKFEMFLGSYSVGGFDNGVDTTGSQLSVSGTQTGSTEFTGFEDYIIVLKTGAVLKLTTIADANTANYSVLLGTDAQIQAGAEYPNVARVLEPDADTASEYYWFDQGNVYPFAGA